MYTCIYVCMHQEHMHTIPVFLNFHKIIVCLFVLSGFHGERYS